MLEERTREHWAGLQEEALNASSCPYPQEQSQAGTAAPKQPQGWAGGTPPESTCSTTVSGPHLSPCPAGKGALGSLPSLSCRSVWTPVTARISSLKPPVPGRRTNHLFSAKLPPFQVELDPTPGLLHSGQPSPPWLQPGSQAAGYVY